MPIPAPSRYSGAMELHEKIFRLRLERDVATATIETVLAVLRRGGLGLHSLNMAPGRHGVDVHLRVHADAPEPLLLCRLRLCNVIGVLKIRELPGSARLADATRSDHPARRAPTPAACAS